MAKRSRVSLYGMDRQWLEEYALAEICSCQFHDLGDNLGSTSDSELVDILSGNYVCNICGWDGEDPEVFYGTI
jgi:hypothetical protein